MEFITDIGLFLAKAVIIVVAIGLVIGLIAAAGAKGKKKLEKGHIEATKLNDRFKHMTDALKHVALDDAERKAEAKAEKKREKAEHAEKKKEVLATRPRRRNASTCSTLTVTLKHRQPTTCVRKSAPSLAWPVPLTR